MLDDVRMAVRLARDFRAFLGRPYRAEDCHRLPKDPFARRDASFLRIMARAVCGNARSPYFALMRQAKVRYGDVAAWVRRQGVEGALAALYGAGVYVALDEFEGRRPIRPRVDGARSLPRGSGLTCPARSDRIGARCCGSSAP